MIFLPQTSRRSCWMWWETQQVTFTSSLNPPPYYQVGGCSLEIYWISLCFLWLTSWFFMLCFLCFSVSQRNNSDCIYICVMAGKMGKFSSLCRISDARQRVIVWAWCVFCPGSEVSELWQVDAITPLFNQTIVEGPHRGLFTTHTDFIMRVICNQTTRWQQEPMIEPELLTEEWREDWMERWCSPVFNISSSSSSSFSSRQHLLHQTSCRWVTHHAHSSICCHLQGDIILDSDGLFLKPQNGTKFPRIWVTSLRLGWAPC